MCASRENRAANPVCKLSPGVRLGGGAIVDAGERGMEHAAIKISSDFKSGRDETSLRQKVTGSRSRTLRLDVNATGRRSGRGGEVGPSARARSRPPSRSLTARQIY
ncbi:hypothetical protein EVAR_45820_1 [Eumeta japonica]|uniref:Uncharacterized protein n=1 Tax=Eumeta variegata TaxID=151549 RepID=A0A4C1WL32_EUMVA|nr:hypothetical protein EVAR_45820_1 [Eumeta japonica]